MRRDIDDSSYRSRSRIVAESQLRYRLTIRLRSDYDVSRAPASIRRDAVNDVINIHIRKKPVS